MESQILISEPSADYELLDSGNGKKLERFGAVVLSRPDPQALWPKNLADSEWKNAWADYEKTGERGKWHILKEIPENWSADFDGLIFNLQLLPSKHVGVFPEQSVHWKWLEEKIVSAKRPVSVLNLFGYSGGSTLSCARAGAEVCHVDASQFAVDLAVKNRDTSGLSGDPIRFIVDDVRKFVEREIKRDKKYDLIVLDPPVYGKGSKKEVWKIEDDLVPLLFRLKEILSNEPLAVLLNGYSSGYSHLAYAQMLGSALEGLGGKISSGELAIKESKSGRLLPSGIFARWEK